MTHKLARIQKMIKIPPGNTALSKLFETSTAPKPDNISRDKWKCGHCNKRFKYQSLMKQHEIVHGTEKVWKCDYHECSFATAHKRSLKRHKLVHNRQKPFLCNICHKKFKKKDLLNQHTISNHIPI